MKIAFGLGLAATLALSAMTLSAQSNCAPVPSSYTITDLGTLGGTGSYAAAVNTSGAVTGESEIAGDAEEHAFLWTASGGMQDLGVLSGGNYSGGLAINSNGDVVGTAGVANNGTHAFLWTSAGGLKDLGTLTGAGGFSYATGIDDHERIVGTSSAQGYPNGVAVVWSGSTIHNLGTIAGTFSEAYAINDKFQIAGTSSTATSLDGFLWTKAGFKDLGQIGGGDGSVALALNNFGMVAGYNSQGIAATPVAVVWNKNGIHVVGNLGGDWGSADAVNDQCQVVGYSLLSDTIHEHAFIWSPGGGTQDLNKLIPGGSGWVLTLANGMNASGQIVGQGTIAGAGHGYLLTPVP
ncbi:MAG TPA: hypothetical protein VJQ82_24860 [Terriglobales bacterium]|nr:hypothetical protein [Terriglobales bacterium]